MRIANVGYSVNYVQLAASRQQFQGKGSNPSTVKQIVEQGRAVATEAGKGAKIDLQA